MRRLVGNDRHRIDPAEGLAVPGQRRIELGQAIAVDGGLSSSPPVTKQEYGRTAV